MAEYNRYHSYYQGKKYEVTPGASVKSWARDKGREMATAKQFEYHSSLVKFLNSKGIKTTVFEKPRTKSDCKSKINAMLTILRKNGLEEEFFGSANDNRNETA